MRKKKQHVETNTISHASLSFQDRQGSQAAEFQKLQDASNTVGKKEKRKEEVIKKQNQKDM
jgi:hypothetical protein